MYITYYIIVLEVEIILIHIGTTLFLHLCDSDDMVPTNVKVKMYIVA